MADRRCVILFVKVPGKGRVKSRLARGMDGDFVLRLYESMVLDTIDMLNDARIPFRICYAPPDAADAVRDWLGPEYDYAPQAGDDLGERMELAFARAFAEGAHEALLIGSDIPGLTASMLDDAFHSFATHDAVIGPANDGGYYLIGFKKNTFSPGIFRDMLWSAPAVFRETMGRLRAASLVVHVAPECIDADTKDDLKKLLAMNEGREASSRAMSLLRHHRKSIME
jgi:hypothetical protein